MAVIINDIWIGKINHGQGMSMQDYVTKYFEERSVIYYEQNAKYRDCVYVSRCYNYIVSVTITPAASDKIPRDLLIST